MSPDLREIIMAMQEAYRDSMRRGIPDPIIGEIMEDRAHWGGTAPKGRPFQRALRYLPAAKGVMGARWRDALRRQRYLPGGMGIRPLPPEYYIR